MFIVKSPYVFNSKIDADSVGKLGPLLDIMPNFAETVKENMLWGIFAEKDIFSLSKGLGKDHELAARGYYSNMFNLPYDFIEEAKSQVKEKFNIEQPKFFAQEVETILTGKQIAASLDYEDCDVKVAAVTNAQKCFNKSNVEVIVSPTLPDSDVVFASLINGNYFEPANTWVLPYMDAYDEWRHEVMRELHDYYIQIGGHGRWVQNNYNGTYVAQVNNDIGDAGSVFIMANEGNIEGYVDMH